MPRNIFSARRLRLVKRFPTAAGSIAILSLTCSPVNSQATWIGPASGGDWGVPGNWSSGVVPTSTTDIRIDGSTANVVLGTGVGQTRNAAGLTIDAGDMVVIDNSSVLNLSGSSAMIDGTLSFNAVSGTSLLRFSNSAASIAGTGVIDFNYQTGSPASGRIEGPGSGSLTNHGTIRGSGTLNNIRFVNSPIGLIENYQSAGQMYLDANNSAPGLFVNQGTIRALAGSLVTLAGDLGGDFNSLGGNIQANGVGAVVRLINNASITGGIFSTSGGGEIVIEAGHQASITPESLSGILRIRNNARLLLSGNMTNNGTIVFSPSGSESFLTINAPLSLSEAGTIQLDWPGSGGAGVIEASSTLTLGAGQVIRGVGSLRNSRVINNGLIDANSGTAALAGNGIYLDSNNTAAGLFVNNGTIRSSAGGYVVFSGDLGGDFINNGTIAAMGDDSITELYNNVTITGGTYTTSGSGVIRVRSGSTASLLGGMHLATGSQFLVPNNSRLNLGEGTYTINGTLDVVAATSKAFLTITTPVTLAGSGTVILQSGTARAQVDGAGMLTIGANQTVRGDGYLREIRAINNGTIIGDVPGQDMYLDPCNAAANLFVNNGTIQALANSFVSLVGDLGGNFTGGGFYRADGTGAFVHLVNSVTVIGGNYATTGGGIIRVPAGHNATVWSPTLTGGTDFRVENNSRLTVSGAFNNGGTLTVSSGSNISYLTIADATTFSGGGQTRLLSNAASRARVDGGGTLIIASGYTFSGDGHFREMRVINDGLILGNVAGKDMYLDASNTSPGLFVNNGTIQASAGGIVTLAGDLGGDFIGAGTYRADGAGAILQLLNNVSVSGGTYSTTAGGQILVSPGHAANINNATLSAGCSLTTSNNTRLNVFGTFTNDGELTIDAGANASFLTITGAASFEGVGMIALLSDAARAQVDGGGTLTIGANQTVRGNGSFREMRVINNGTIVGDVAGKEMYLDPSNNAAGLFVNNGTIRASDGGQVTLAGDLGGSFAGIGSLVAEANSKIVAINNIGGSMGPVSGAGTYRATASANITHTHFRVGTLLADNGGRANVAAGGGTLGTSCVGTVATSTNGRIDLTDNDLVVTATPLNDVTTQIRSGLVNNGTYNWLGPGIMSSTASQQNQAAGSFLYGLGVILNDLAQVGGSGPIYSEFSGISLSVGEVLVKFTYHGDADLSGSIDATDYSLIDNGYVNTLSGWINGDFDYSGSIDATDYALIDNAYVNQAGPLAEALIAEHARMFGGEYLAALRAVQSGVIPEPGAAVVALAAAALRRRVRAAGRAR
ncbi:beta strand repeat-containing protein [Fontivita pretiosa]|uniref:beta strand repeat-containing protein n=1 Tax=Fontivita pretiosa TaxID=2989684 RepID=UPI003D170713